MIKTSLALLVGRIIKLIIKLIGKGKGEAAPGLVALKIDPNFISNRQQNISKRIIISGTNGKTTTTHLIGKLLLSHNKKIITNSHGSNLSRGIASALLQNAAVDIALWETDEAAFTDIFAKTQPTHVFLLNIFRDQLDRYGEVDNTVKKWLKILKNSTPITLVINADDPNLELIARNCPQHKIIRFGMQKIEEQKDRPENYGDALFCPICGKPLEYKVSIFSHLGNYQCSCGFGRGKLDYNITYQQNKIFINRELVTYQLLGVYSAYNIAASIILRDLLDLDPAISKQAIAQFRPAFGRQEMIEYYQKKIQIILIKNPTAANQNLEILKQRKDKLNLLIIINDNFADGRDVSWLWDVDFGMLKKRVNQVIISGTRAFDMGLRLKYAGYDMQKIKIEPNLTKAIRLIKIDKEINFDILPTYTAMLEVRKLLNQNVK